MGILVQIMAAGGQSYFELKNGAPKMPRLALGTWKSPPQKTKQAVLTAVKAGYRFIDCANDYDNEHVIGEALQVSRQPIRGRDVSPRPIRGQNTTLLFRSCSRREWSRGR